MKDIKNKEYYNKTKKIDIKKTINKLGLKNNSDITVVEK